MPFGRAAPIFLLSRILEPSWLLGYEIFSSGTRFPDDPMIMSSYVVLADNLRLHISLPEDDNAVYCVIVSIFLVLLILLLPTPVDPGTPRPFNPRHPYGSGEVLFVDRGQPWLVWPQ